jgi:aryl-alcohol dehydrogenase-like predicted oxidoreductase
MKTRKLGKLEVSETGFGCMSISANYGPAACLKGICGRLTKQRDQKVSDERYRKV